MMKCPNCKYEYGWDSKTMTNIKGEKGDFFCSQHAERDHQIYVGELEKNDVYGCPNCGIMFMEIL